ncbi:ribosome small subunit-dependent GTPase A, partial [bacterium]|nr:ribosome small subunit-dependent GTPase A [bacterium]
ARSHHRKVAASTSRSKGATPLEQTEANSTVIEVFPQLCRVRLDQDSSERLCSYRRAQVYEHGLGGEGTRERSPVAVGDRVKVSSSNPQSGVVEGVARRENQLIRPAPGRERDENSGIQPVHVVAANVQDLVIVASTRNPDFSPGLIDRFLVAAQLAGICPILCVSKIDLFEGGQRPWEVYQSLGIPVYEISSKVADGIEALSSKLVGRKVVFCGHSGVGKTSLLRVLTGREIGRVGEVNDSTGKGRHTTTSAVLLHAPGDSLWIDTPGMRAFGLIGVKPESLQQYFPELESADCADKPCSHGSKEESPGCAARGFPRYDSFARIRQSLIEGES